MEKHLCADCSREFETAESCDQHRQAKHAALSAVSAKKRKLPVGRMLVAIIILAVLGGAYFAFARSAGSPEAPDATLVLAQGESADGLQKMMSFNLRQHTGSLALHIHPVVEIQILGVTEPIPANIGVTSRGMRVIHTHDASGELHIESPTAYQFRLKDFFAIWGKKFNETCILDYCADEAHTLDVYVNGARSDQHGLVPLRDHDQVLVVYAEKK